MKEDYPGKKLVLNYCNNYMIIEIIPKNAKKNNNKLCKDAKK